MNSTRTLSPNPALHYMSEFFNETSFNYKNTISDVSVARISKDDEDPFVMVMVTTTMPGVLIGKGGQYINALEAYLNKMIEPNFPIKIYITENKLWYNTLGEYEEFERKCKEY